MHAAWVKTKCKFRRGGLSLYDIKDNAYLQKTRADMIDNLLYPNSYGHDTGLQISDVIVLVVEIAQVKHKS